MFTILERFAQNNRLPEGELVNDVHSRLNPTFVKKRIAITGRDEIVQLIRAARINGDHICIAGGRHSMGGQQFLGDGILLDTNAMKKVLNFDYDHGLITIEAGMLWPDLISYLQNEQQGKEPQWTIAQKQTGSDSLSIGGSISANGHGRGLSMSPMVADVESLELILEDGKIATCSREQNKELFGLLIGGYGMFGVIASVTLRLIPRRKLRRTVELAKAEEAIEKLEHYKTLGATYGDFQFGIDDQSPDFLSKGILSVYTPVGEKLEPSPDNKLLSFEDWQRLLYLAHTNKSAAFDKYADHYLSTNGQLYWSDTFQLATYLDDYHRALDTQLPACGKGTEMITELYVPRNKFGQFMQDAGRLLRAERAEVIYGTVRIIEKDNDTFMPWAKQNYACIVINLHVEHTPHQIVRASKAFCDLISLAIGFGGSYFLTYHRFAGRDQLLSCYPEMPEFMKQKTKYDPYGLFWSDWFEHCNQLVMGKGLGF